MISAGSASHPSRCAHRRSPLGRPAPFSPVFRSFPSLPSFPSSFLPIALLISPDAPARGAARPARLTPSDGRPRARPVRPTVRFSRGRESSPVALLRGARRARVGASRAVRGAVEFAAAAIRPRGRPAWRAGPTRPGTLSAAVALKGSACAVIPLLSPPGNIPLLHPPRSGLHAFAPSLRGRPRDHLPTAKNASCSAAELPPGRKLPPCSAQWSLVWAASSESDRRPCWVAVRGWRCPLPGSCAGADAKSWARSGSVSSTPARRLRPGRRIPTEDRDCRPDGRQMSSSCLPCRR
ncbi:hypothetical protein T484DRAFT_3007255 [Baffinella frigidus]|nr:hypothetical protein T484DRAFT_3007255 [Cryptophyta sp. CCMP2293]